MNSGMFCQCKRLHRSVLSFELGLMRLSTAIRLRDYKYSKEKNCLSAFKIMARLIGLSNTKYSLQAFPSGFLVLCEKQREKVKIHILV